jgi:hypothetical protein
MTCVQDPEFLNMLKYVGNPEIHYFDSIFTSLDLLINVGDLCSEQLVLLENWSGYCPLQA